MRYLSLGASLVAVASARNWVGVDADWAVGPDKTAEWYREHDEPLPELAQAITTVEANRSYVVKVECVGCPFRHRGVTTDSWQMCPPNNSLVSTYADCLGVQMLTVG
jgi:hypothetical protein